MFPLAGSGGSELSELGSILVIAIYVLCIDDAVKIILFLETVEK